MKVVTIHSFKGGVGKSSMTTLLSRCLGRAGYRVCEVDGDLNNSITFADLPDEFASAPAERNFAKALFSGDNLEDNIVVTKHLNVSLIPSSMELSRIENGVSENRILQLLPSIQDKYDIVIFDAPPHYSPMVTAMYKASDLIITPVNLAQFDYNTAAYIGKMIKLDTDKFDNWFITVNGYDHNFEDAKTGKQRDYVELFKSEFSNLTPVSTWFPWTPAVRESIDREEMVSSIDNAELFKEKMGFVSPFVYAPALHKAVCELAESFLDESLTRPEAF